MGNEASGSFRCTFLLLNTCISRRVDLEMINNQVSSFTDVESVHRITRP